MGGNIGHIVSTLGSSGAQGAYQGLRCCELVTAIQIHLLKLWPGTALGASLAGILFMFAFIYAKLMVSTPLV